MTDPLSLDEVDDELRNQFNNLMEAMRDIVSFNPNREEGAYEALNQRIHQAVTDKPVLARIIASRGRYLLSVACNNLNLETSHNVIKCLIQAYPPALLASTSQAAPIYVIANHPQHCVLMPWIAANYPWILDHDRRPHVVFGLLQMYAQRQRTSCTAATLRQFLEAYPRAFTQKHPEDGNILHYVLASTQSQDREECEVDLFKWIAERCPTSDLLGTDSYGHIPLHSACMVLSKHKGPDSSEICKYLIQKCPGSVRIDDHHVYGNLPIHLLQRGCGYRAAREVAVCLLREYPESYDMRAQSFDSGHPPSSVPFIQSIKPLLDEEKELKETAVSLTSCNSSLTKAVACTNNDLVRSSSTAFDSWATSYINSTGDKLQLISTQLQDMCNEGLESDE